MICIKRNSRFLSSRDSATDAATISPLSARGNSDSVIPNLGFRSAAPSYITFLTGAPSATENPPVFKSFSASVICAPDTKGLASNSLLNSLRGTFSSIMQEVYHRRLFLQHVAACTTKHYAVTLLPLGTLADADLWVLFSYITSRFLFHQNH